MNIRNNIIISNKLNNFYILYYIFILFKSFFIILNIKYNKKYLYRIYYFLILYIKLYYIYYIIFKNYNYYIYNFNYIYFYIYEYNQIILNYNNKINNINIIEKIIEIKKISYTIKKGRIKRYKIILLIGNKQGWVGIGIGKSINMNKAILLSKIDAFNNIYYFKYSVLNLYKLKYIYINCNKFFIKIKFKICNYFDIKFLLLKYLFECLGYLNCKIIICYNIINNKYNLLNKILLILFNLF
ncbi:apicoplast ribosomal protein S5, putative (apicoplast) [Plasmodium ovale]|uniref:Apicoplast ribosomal protein S5, putative n=1 Tax=Plasmodium ovale TaxID=36330 RepID=H7CDC4_PLAOA|nr:small subunit ribosomal protein 5 [Plasmodium ovale]SCQ17338.1 apicoplast ribosomal protein S5, putative [Plasmodium ovale]